jgi:hypothetical protein
MIQYITNRFFSPAKGDTFNYRAIGEHMVTREEKKNTKEAEIQNIMTLMCVPYASAVELYHEFNRIECGKSQVPANV